MLSACILLKWMFMCVCIVEIWKLVWVPHPHLPHQIKWITWLWMLVLYNCLMKWINWKNFWAKLNLNVSLLYHLYSYMHAFLEICLVLSFMAVIINNLSSLFIPLKNRDFLNLYINELLGLVNIVLVTLLFVIFSSHKQKDIRWFSCC